MTTTAVRSDQETSADFVMPENRRPGLYLRTYKVAADGMRYDESPVVTLDPDDVTAAAYHPSATWLACSCGQFGHGGRCPPRLRPAIAGTRAARSRPRTLSPRTGSGAVPSTR